MLLWKLSVSSKFTGGQYCFIRFLPETLQYECSERKNINSSVSYNEVPLHLMLPGNRWMVSSKNYETVIYLGHHPCSKLVLTIKLYYS